jgi:hypothetical protein
MQISPWLLRLLLLGAGCAALLLVATQPPPEPIADRLSEPQQLQLRVVLQRF